MIERVMAGRKTQTTAASDLAARHTRARAAKRGLPKEPGAEARRRSKKRAKRKASAANHALGRVLRASLLVVLAMGVAVGGALAFRSVTGSQLFAVRQIEVEGNQRTSREELLALLGDKTSASLWQLNLEEIRAALKKHVWIRDAEVTRQLPGKLLVRINEREPFALVRRSDSSVVWIDRDGTVLGDHARFNREVIPPLINGLAEGTAPKVMETNRHHLEVYQQLLQELDEREPRLSRQVDEVIFDGVNGLKLRVKESQVEVLVGTRELRKRLLEALKILDAVERKDISALQLLKISDAERLLGNKPIAYINATVAERAIVGLAE
jgi:cell division protein FtsQ